jgi:hypothetical protein
MPIPPPRGLCSLVASYEGKHQAPVRFRPSSWERSLADAGPGLTRLLLDDRYTQAYVSQPSSRAADRTVTRAAIRSACKDIDWDNADQVLPCFVLVMAWGSGTTGSRGLRNTARAVRNSESAHAALAKSALLLRQSSSISDRRLEKAHATFALPGIRQPFFTKWFSFAGQVAGRRWQPLILDSRVYATLNETLDVTTISMAGGTRRRAVRYAAYVDTLHSWARFLSDKGCDADAERLEWILFQHRGGPLPPSDRCHQR